MLRVAIVDDDTSHGRAFARLLRASGMEAGCFDSAETFLEAGSAERFDCLVLDIQLGGMSGFALATRLSASGCATPVVFLTALPGAESAERATRTGSVCLRKTDPAAVVLDAIRRAAVPGASFPKG